MKFSLGKPKDKTEWHNWFVWHPIIYTGNSGNRIFIWLRWVQRQQYSIPEGVAYDIRTIDGQEID